MTLAAVTLDDKYELETGRVFLTGTQALVRLPMMQRQRDLKAGLNTACFISGYRGSPLGAVDLQLWQAREFLKQNHIHFQPGVNEDLAATSIWGTQQTNMYGDSNYDGVFSMWYGKGPGVDRSGDAVKHANHAGTDPNGGVLMLVGDDHTCKSSSLPNQSEFACMDYNVPLLAPSSVQDFLDMGMYGWAMSRYAGLWVGFKCTADTTDSSASCYIDPHRIDMKIPTDFEMPEGGVHIRWPDGWYDVEERLVRYKVPAAQAFVRANGLDKIVMDSPKARLGIVTAGKSYQDVREALADLGIDEARAAEIGIRVYKVALAWPIEPQGMLNFAKGLEEILIVEEKRNVMEDQIKALLFNLPDSQRPRVVGKTTEDGDLQLRWWFDLPPAMIAKAIGNRISRFFMDDQFKERLAHFESFDVAAQAPESEIKRLPYFCSGCPHNTSTRVPEGSRAMAGIGCHYMATFMDRNTSLMTHMGAEGSNWIGQYPFVKTNHVFQNIGDGTYFHSGLMAIRAAVSAKVTMTYKILFNDAVAMTGGQPVDGPLTAERITQQVYGEGVVRIAVVTDEPEKYPVGIEWAPGVSVHHRDELNAIQHEFREIEGVSVIVYDQTCAAEKRRRRKRNLFFDPPKRAFINEDVCEGCGDCGKKSNCVSVLPVETELGRKREIDQSACNKDYSCLKGFCPSFVSVLGGNVRKAKPVAADEAVFSTLPDPEIPAVQDGAYGIIVTGVGGTGVVTIGALLGMAAHIEGKGVSVLDMVGFAQKGGGVMTQIKIADKPEDIHAIRLGNGGANVMIGCDVVVAADRVALSTIDRGRSRAVINSHETITGDFTRLPDMEFPTDSLLKNVTDWVGGNLTDIIDVNRIATALMGDSIATNLFMVGFAYQRGLIPLSAEAIEKAIELNGVAIDMNQQAFVWGRRAAYDLDAVRRAATPAGETLEKRYSQTAEEIVADRLPRLTAYQDATYAQRYENLIRRVQAAEGDKTKGMTGLTEAVARYYFKLLAYKDEYEVARLYTSDDFKRRLHNQFEGDFKLKILLAPPLIAERDKITGQLIKREYGQWILSAFKLLRRFKFLRGTSFDPFGYSTERKRERSLIAEYEAVIDELLAGLDHDNHALAVEIAEIPDHIRGYGHVKDEQLAEAKEKEQDLLAAFRSPEPRATAAE